MNLMPITLRFLGGLVWLIVISYRHQCNEFQLVESPNKNWLDSTSTAFPSNSNTSNESSLFAESKAQCIESAFFFRIFVTVKGLRPGYLDKVIFMCSCHKNITVQLIRIFWIRQWCAVVTAAIWHRMLWRTSAFPPLQWFHPFKQFLPLPKNDSFSLKQPCFYEFTQP